MTQLRSMNIAKAAQEASRVLMFDHWLRFYFVVEEQGKLFVRIPEERLEDIRTNHGEYLSLVEMVNEAELTFQKSQATVCAFIGARFDGSKYDPSIMPQVFDSKEFKIEMYVFNLWMKGHEAYLDEGYLDFAEWMEMYANWQEMDEVKAYLTRLKKSPHPDLSREGGPVQ